MLVCVYLRVFVVNYYKRCVFVVYYFCVFYYSSLLREYVAAAVQFLSQNIKNTCRRSRKLSYEDYLQK